MIDSDRERLVGLLAARDRGDLDADGETDLRRAIAGDRDAAAVVGGDQVVERLLRYAATTDLGEEEFARGVVGRIHAERRGDAFVRRVTRAARRIPARNPDPGAGWLPLGLAAACAVLLGFFGWSGPIPTPTKVIESVSITTVEPAAPPQKETANPEPLLPVVPKIASAPKDQPLVPGPRRTEPPAPESDPIPAVIATPPPPKSTVATIGTVEREDGTVAALLAGQTVENGPRGSAVLRFADGTRIDLGEQTTLVVPESGKRYLLSRGSLLADVTKQPKGSPLLFATPNAEATVLGTTLRLIVGPEDKGSTRLEVLEGKVRLTRALDGKSVDVPSGHYAVTVAGTELKSRALPDPRVTEGLRALYAFEEGKGRVIRDVSGVGSPLNLVVKDESDLAWLSGGGIALRSPTLIASPGPATKIVAACRSSRAITVEAWIRPAQVEKGTLRYIVALSGSRKESLAFGLGLHADIDKGPTTYRAYLATPKTMPPSDQMPDLESTPIVPALAHVVFTRSAAGIATLYVDGVERGSGMIDGDFSNWSDTLRVMLGDYSFEGIRPWLGEFHLLAFYGRALKTDEVAQNFDAGKKKYSLRK